MLLLIDASFHVQDEFCRAMKSLIFWNVILRTVVDGYQRFDAAYCFRLRSRRQSQASSKRNAVNTSHTHTHTKKIVYCSCAAVRTSDKTFVELGSLDDLDVSIVILVFPRFVAFSKGK
jgi:hypothetical protein